MNHYQTSTKYESAYFISMSENPFDFSEIKAASTTAPPEQKSRIIRMQLVESFYSDSILYSIEFDVVE